MSSAEAAPADEAPPPAPKSRKKLVLILLAATLAVVLAGGGATVFVLKKRAAAAAAETEEGAEGAEAGDKHAAKAKKGTPTFVALESFTVNLADREAERYAQIGVTLELDEAKFADEMKVYMPAIRNAILMILAHKTSQELLERSGKQALAEEIMREVPRTMGLEVGPPAGAASGAKKPKDSAPAHNPVRNVLFSNFIIQ